MRALVSAASAAGVPLSGQCERASAVPGRRAPFDHDVRLPAQPLRRHEDGVAGDTGELGGVGRLLGLHRRRRIAGLRY